MAVNHRNPRKNVLARLLRFRVPTGRGVLCSRRHSPAAPRLHRTGRRGTIRPGRRVSGSSAFFLRDKIGRPRHAAPMFRLESDEGLVRLVLDRPEARNAIPAAGWRALGETIAGIEAGDARLLVVTGAGGTFCAGADLADFASMRADPAAIARFREEMRAALDRLAALPIPTIALILGHCYGAGVALAMACDLRIAAPEAAFAITPAKLGISYPQEDVHRLVALVGPGQAARLLLGGQAIEGEVDNRIDCRPAGQAAFTRSCTVEGSDGPDGRILTIRKADGGFRRLRIASDGTGVAAADGAEPAHVSLAPDQRLEVEIGGDHF